jgi:hypothetical protein
MATSVADCHTLPELLHVRSARVWTAAINARQRRSTRASPITQDMTYRRTKLEDYVDQRRVFRPRPSIRSAF